MNKKGIATLAIIGMVVVGLILLVVAASKGLATKATSFTAKKVGCNAPTLKAIASGDFVVEDAVVIGIEPEVTKIDNFGIRAIPLSLEGFNWEAELFDADSGVKLDSTKGNSDLNSDEKSIKVPFSLSFNVDDNNCDGKVDDTRLTLKITTTETDDVFKGTSTFQQDYTVKNGVIVR